MGRVSSSGTTAGQVGRRHLKKKVNHGLEGLAARDDEGGLDLLGREAHVQRLLAHLVVQAAELKRLSLGHAAALDVRGALRSTDGSGEPLRRC